MEQIEKLLSSVVERLYGQVVPIELSRPEPQFGDFATNVALRLAKPVGKSPREIASEITGQLESGEIVATDVAGPGFINITLSDAALLMLAESGSAKPYDGDTVVIETNNPNPFKAMHIGHAFNAVLGDTVANLLEAGGANVYRVSYHGDIGTHVGKSMYSLLKFADGDASKLDSVPESERNSFMSQMYAEGAAAYNDDGVARAEIDELARQSFTREDRLYAEVYNKCKDWSFKQIDKNVARLGNRPVERRFLESDADSRGVPIVRANVPEVFQESDGALIFKGSNYGSFDNIFVSSRGLGLYGARDLGLAQLKNEYYHPKKSYIVTAEEQRDYFKGVLAAIGLAMPELKGVTVNISTGTVKLATGKMSSRTGEVVEIDWLFDQVSEAIKARGSEPSDELVAGALRYQFLKVRVGNDVIFDVGEAVSLQGNSGSYLQYAYARAQSILKKATSKPQSLSHDHSLNESERQLVRKLSEFPEAISRSIAELMPHTISNYLFELAQEFNRFYENNKVIGSDQESVRLGLVSLYADKLKQGLDLLGIHAPDKM